MYKISYITGRTAHITATQCMLQLYSNVRKNGHHVLKRNIGFACDVHPDAHYGRYANGWKIVHSTFSDAVVCFYPYHRLTLTYDINIFTYDINNKPHWKYVRYGTFYYHLFLVL